MLQYVIAGLVIGGIYAIAAAGLVVTYLSAGILNFSFGAEAYFVARCYYYLNSQLHWTIIPAALVSIVVVGPALGVVLYLTVFRTLRLSSSLVKVVATLGLFVLVPAAAGLCFGGEVVLIAPGLAPRPVRVFDVLGVPVTMDQLIAYCCVVAVVVIGAVVLRYSDVGLRVRAMVDSPAMTALSGTNPGLVSLSVWAASTGLAGLAGVLAAPIIGLDAGNFTLLVVGSFAAVIAARLRSLPIAVGVGLAIGIAGALVQYLLPPSSQFTSAVLPSIPFVFTAAFLVVFMIRSGGADESADVGGALDRALALRSGPDRRRAQHAVLVGGPMRSVTGALARPAVGVFALVAALPFVVRGFWIGVIGQGVAYGIIFLSVTVVTGEGGMIWLCQITFAGVGGLTMAQLAITHGWPVMAAVLAGGVVALPLGLGIGLLTVRFGDLYVALVTLIFGLLTENLVFSRQIFQNNGLGVSITPPQFASSPRAFVYLSLGVFAVIAVLLVNLRGSTTGLALRATRSSEPGSKMIGISVRQMRMLVAGIGAFVAGIGGAMLAIALGDALPSNYSTLEGVLWLVVLVTLGIRSIVAALVAGLVFTLLVTAAQVYLPVGVGGLIPLVFGVGAIRVAKFPEGWLGRPLTWRRRATR